MKAVKSVLCVGVLTLGLTSCGAPHNFMNDQVWHHSSKHFKSRTELNTAYETDKQQCEIELQEVLPGVYDPAFTTGSYGKCLTNKGWEYERPIFGAARRMNSKFPK